jgi:peptide/nickel transport system substrate-binding protein
MGGGFDSQSRLNRRSFVRLLGIAAGGGVLAACSPSAPAQPAATAAVPKPTTAAPAAATDAPKPTTAPAAAATTAPAAAAATAAKPAKFTEAPAVADMVKQGKLPPIDQRLPDNPLVVQPIEEIGQYGGTWRGAFTGVADFHAYGRNVYEAMLRWPRDPHQAILPGLAEQWEFSPTTSS